MSDKARELLEAVRHLVEYIREFGVLRGPRWAISRMNTSGELLERTSELRDLVDGLLADQGVYLRVRGLLPVAESLQPVVMDCLEMLCVELGQEQNQQGSCTTHVHVDVVAELERAARRLAKIQTVASVSPAGSDSRNNVTPDGPAAKTESTLPLGPVTDQLRTESGDSADRRLLKQAASPDAATGQSTSGTGEGTLVDDAPPSKSTHPDPATTPVGPEQGTNRTSLTVKKLSKELITHVDGYLHWIDEESQYMSPENVGDPPVAQFVTHAEHLTKRALRCREALGVDIQRVGRELATELTAMGKDASTLLRLVVSIEPHGGGPDVLIQLWGDVKPHLLAISMRLDAVASPAQPVETTRAEREATEKQLAAIRTLDLTSGEWIGQIKAARLLAGLGDMDTSDDATSKASRKVGALQAARGRGLHDPQKTKGIDRQGNVWRSDPNSKKQFWYLRDSLSTEN